MPVTMVIVTPLKTQVIIFDKPALLPADVILISIVFERSGFEWSRNQQ